MKLKSAIILCMLVAVFVIVAGCASSGGPEATQNPSSSAVSSPPPGTTANPSTTVPHSLTDAQKTQAANIVKADSEMNNVLNTPGYKIFSTVAGTDAGTAIVSIKGNDQTHDDGSLWMSDQYTVFVDLNNNKVTKTLHIDPKPLSTPVPVT